MNNNEPDNANNQFDEVPNNVNNQLDEVPNNVNDQYDEAPKKVMGKSIKIGIIIAILAVVGVFAAVVIVNNDSATAENPKEYVENAWSETWDTYSSELKTLADNNAVFSKFSSFSGKPTTHTLSIGGEYAAALAYQMGLSGLPNFKLDFILQNDPVNKLFSLGTQIPLLGEVAIYLSDDELVVGAMGVYLSAQAKTILSEVREFAVNSDLDASVFDELAVDEIDLSYSNLFIVSDDIQYETPEELTPIIDRYKALWNELYDKAEAELVDEATVELEGQSENCSMVKLNFKGDDIKLWLPKLYETISTDQDLKDYMAEQYQMNPTYSYNYGSFDDMYNEFLTALQDVLTSYEGGDITLNFYIYENAVVRTSMIMQNPSEEITSVEMNLSVSGKEYRLNEILLTGFSKDKDGDIEEISLSIKGNHIGKGIMTSESIVDGETVYNFSWDPAAGENNLQVETQYETYNMTFAIEGDDVVLKPINSSDDVVYRAKAVEPGMIEWPSNTQPLKETTLMDLYSLLY